MYGCDVGTSADILWPWGKDQGAYTDINPEPCHPSAAQLWTSYRVRKINPLWCVNDRTGLKSHPFLYPHPLQYDFAAAPIKRQSSSLHSLKSELDTCLALVTGYGRSDIVPVLSLGSKKPLALSLTLGTLTLPCEQSWASLEQGQVSLLVPSKTLDIWEPSQDYQTHLADLQVSNDGWVRPTKLRSAEPTSQLKDSWAITNNCCFKPLSFRMVCYAAIANCYITV